MDPDLHASVAFDLHAGTGLYYQVCSFDVVDVPAADLAKDSTGVATIWPATEAIVSYFKLVHEHRAHREWLCQLASEGATELGAGLGIAGMQLAAALDVSVTLTDYHPIVLQALRSAIEKNGLRARCGAATLDWDAPEIVGSARSLVFGADLAVSARSASSLARAVTSTLSHPDGVFLYAHTVRRAIYMKDGALAREATDSALMALCAALGANGRGLDALELSHHRSGGQLSSSGRRLKASGQPASELPWFADGEHLAKGDEESVVLLAFGMPHALDRIPSGTGEMHAIVALDPAAGVALQDGILEVEKRKLAGMQQAVAEATAEEMRAKAPRTARAQSPEAVASAPGED